MRFTTQTVLALLTVYLIWGSTYLGILYAIETMEPWSMTAIRFAIAGLCTSFVAWYKREPPLARAEFVVAIKSGVMLMTANGFVCVMERWVPSGLTAVVIGASPIWFMLIGWMAFGTGQPSVRKIVGAGIGLIGIALIATGDTHTQSDGSFGVYAPLALCFSSLLWVTGTLVQRKVSVGKSGFRFLSLQMGSGAVVTLLLSLIFESPLSHDWTHVSSLSWLALAYLVSFGSLIAFTAYSWLSRNVEPHVVSSYALVNPVIAVWLGWFLADEPLTGKFIGATLLVLLGLGVLMVPEKFRRR